MTLDARKSRLADLIPSLGTSSISESAYDTAWVARLGDIDSTLSNRALDWLRENQLADGSWGNPYLEYHHERLICTLAAVTALGSASHVSDRARIEKGLAAVSKHETRLDQDYAGATIGFEMIVPALIEEAEALGVYSRTRSNPLLDRLIKQRNAKLMKLPNGMINRYVSAAFSAEMLGGDTHVLDAGDLQEPNGSVGYSPSATSYFSLHVRPGDPDALGYLHHITEGGIAPTVGPIDVFELGWGLWNIAITGGLDVDPLLHDLCQPALSLLQAAWTSGRGVGPMSGSLLTDGDDSAVVHDVFSRYHLPADLDALLSYEDDEAFICFPFESNKSISTNIHILGALISAGVEVRSRSIQKAFAFLAGTRMTGGYWVDKWHASPYYPTSHAIIACVDAAAWLVEPAVEWLLRTQRPDGSWGYFMPTLEETAYAVQALAIWRSRGHAVPADVITSGAAWLTRSQGDPIVPLWIGKSLYSPTLVVESAVLSALTLAHMV